jgi:hypothetical protein
MYLYPERKENNIFCNFPQNLLNGTTCFTASRHHQVRFEHPLQPLTDRVPPSSSHPLFSRVRTSPRPSAHSIHHVTLSSKLLLSCPAHNLLIPPFLAIFLCCSSPESYLMKAVKRLVLFNKFSGKLQKNIPHL